VSKAVVLIGFFTSWQGISDSLPEATSVVTHTLSVVVLYFLTRVLLPVGITAPEG